MRGIEEYRQSDGFWVFKLHYTADPHKADNEEWKAEAQKGLTKKQWDQEYEMDISSMEGNLIYPGFSQKDNVLNVALELLPKTWTSYMSIDPGIGVPCGILWAMVSPDGYIIFYDEYYENNKTVEEIAKIIKDKEDRVGIHPRVRLIDPSAFNRDFHGNSVARVFADNGIQCLGANNVLEAGITLVRQLLSPLVEGKSRVMFLSSLHWIFYEFKRYIVRNGKPRKKKDHLMDCMRYIISQNPHWVDPKGKDDLEELVDPLTGYISYERRRKDGFDDDDDE